MSLAAALAILTAVSADVRICDASRLFVDAKPIDPSTITRMPMPNLLVVVTGSATPLLRVSVCPTSRWALAST